jgi:hypothetical protein
MKSEYGKRYLWRWGNIQKARNQYNRYVGKLNTNIESFPANLIARKFGFEKQKLFYIGTGNPAGIAGRVDSSFKIPESKSKR